MHYLGLLVLYISIIANPITKVIQKVFSYPDASDTSDSQALKERINPVIGFSEIELFRTTDGTSTIYNMVCDIMLERTAADFSFLNFGDLYADLDRGEIRHLDMFALCPFNRMLIIVEMDGKRLKEIIESKICGIRPGFAIGGGKVNYDTERVNYSRLTFFEIGGYPFYPQRIYRVVTTDYLVQGNAGFDLLKEMEEQTIHDTGIGLRDCVEEYIINNSPLNMNSLNIDKRWQKNKTGENN